MLKTEFNEYVKKARAGDANAFSKLYSLVYKDLYRIALLNLNNNQHDASDVVSDTVLEAYSSIKKLRDENAFKSWITKILTVKIKRKQKEYIIKRENFQDNDDENDVAQNVSTEFNFNGLEILEEFSKLNEEERLVLSLSIVSEYKSEEIAKMIGVPASTVRTKVARAKIKLKDLLSEG